MKKRGIYVVMAFLVFSLQIFASTFKIYNSLIGLHTGAVKDVDEVFYKYNGEKVFLKSWNGKNEKRDWKIKFWE